MAMSAFLQTLPNLAVPFDMLPVSAGTFWMGTQKNDPNAPNFAPDTFGGQDLVHQVTVKDFLVGQFPVTQDVWTAIMGENPSYFKGARRPVETVSWDDAQLFIAKLNEGTQHSRPKGYAYRLPTESEWEYAARGGIKNDGNKYAGSDKLKDVGWCEGNSHQETKPVGLKYPNPLGLYDMSGNVWEWCEDDWHDDYKDAPDNGSAWIDSPERGLLRVYRGGSWDGLARPCRATYRFYDAPDSRGYYMGFRLVLSLQSVGSPLPAFL